MSDRDKPNDPQDQEKPVEQSSVKQSSKGKASKNETAIETDKGAGPTAIEAQVANHSTATTDNKAAPHKAAPPKTARGKRRFWPFFMGLGLLLLIIALFVAAGRWLQSDLDAREQQFEARIGALQNQLGAAQERFSALSQAQDELRQARPQQQQQILSRLEEVEQTLAYQRDRLRELSTTTRADWLLAEARYLLKLANQRLLIEGSTETAEGLLAQADKILRELNNPQLTPLRRAIARDLTQLKLAAQVDLEGLYLRLAALAESVPLLPTRSRLEAVPQNEDANQQNPPSQQEPKSWWQGILTAVGDMFSNLGNYIRIRDHAEPPTPILPPAASQYLQQNLRLMLERAQLAAMRQEAQIYRRSLENVTEWARRFYPPSQELNNFIAQVKGLADIDVQQDLPDISQSLQMLDNYIDRLHDLDSQEAQP